MYNICSCSGSLASTVLCVRGASAQSCGLVAPVELGRCFFVVGRVIDMEKDNNYNIIIGELRFAWDENKNTCHCYRCNDEIIRLISARKATLRESKQYHSFL